MPQCKKPCHEDPIDRISDLPSNVIDSILQQLPIDELVRTSTLSRKWKYIWALVPQLEFENDFFERCNHLDYRETSRIITEVLMLHNGPIHRFNLEIPSDFPIRMECFNKWILFLSRNGIKVLELVNFQTDPYQTPSHLFFCDKLTYLELHNFKLSSPPRFQGFKTLVDLHLYYITFESNALDSLMSGCLLLVKLTISFCSGFEYINILAPGLKVLNVKGDQVIKSICLEKAENLTDLTLLYFGPKDSIERSMAYKVIKGLPKIKSLCLSTGYIYKIFSMASLPQMLQRSLNCLKYLNLDDLNFNETKVVSFILSALKSSPNIEELIMTRFNDTMDMGPTETVEELGYENFWLSQLQTVRITVKTSNKNTLNMIQFLLVNSTSLKLLVFKILGENQSDDPSVLGISRDLLQMRRASQKVDVKFLYNDYDFY